MTDLLDRPTAAAVHAAAEQIYRAKRGQSLPVRSYGNQEADPSVVIGPNTFNNVNGLFRSYAPMAYMIPFEMLDFIELLAVYNPDYSQAVENMRTLANPGHTILVNATAGVAKRVAKKIDEKNRTIQHKYGGIEGLVDKLLWQATVYGAMAGEWVANEDMTDIVDFVEVNPKTIRFFWEDDVFEDPFQIGPHWAPYQRATNMQIVEAQKRGQKTLNGAYVKLNELTFQYFAFSAAPGSPYGVPPFLAALNNIAIQRDMMGNMAAVVKKLALLGLIDIEVKALSPMPGESPEAFEQRATAYIEAYANLATQMLDDGGVVHFDDATVNQHNLSGNAAGATNIFTQNEEQVFSGLKSMPSVQGRCLDPRSRILMIDGTVKMLREIVVGDQIQGFDEKISSSRRRWRAAKVENIWYVRKRSLRLHLSDGRSVLCSEDHPFLMQLQKTGSQDAVTVASKARLSEVGRDAANARWNGHTDEFKGTDWRRASNIFVGDWIKAIDEPLGVNYDSDDYKAGYVSGVTCGDGAVRQKSPGKYCFWQLAVQLSDDAIIERCKEYLVELGIPEPIFSDYVREPNIAPKGKGFAGTQPMRVLKTCRNANVEFIFDLLRGRESQDYKAGWLAGLFDTDGNHSARERGRVQLRICQEDGKVKDAAFDFLEDLGFSCVKHPRWIEILGDRMEKWRFTASVRPVLPRKQVSLDEHTVRTFKPVQVVKIDQVGYKTLIDLSTSTSTLVANGLLTHNSYSTTETYAGVAYDIMIRESLRFQRAVKLMMEYGYNLMVTLWGDKVDSVHVKFNQNKSLQRLQIAQAEHTEIINELMKWAAGVTDQTQMAHSLGYPDVKTVLDEVPNSPWFAAGANLSVSQPYEEAPNPEGSNGKPKPEGDEGSDEGTGDGEAEGGDGKADSSNE